jgi:hypothetical protein
VANHHSARPISATSGTSFSVVVTIERSPTARVLLILTSVSSQTQPTASSAGGPASGRSTEDQAEIADHGHRDRAVAGQIIVQ